MIKLYSHGCPNCIKLSNKLSEKNIEFEEIINRDELIEFITQNNLNSCMPKLQLSNGIILEYADAMKWVSEL